MNPALRLEIGSLMILLFININYYSAKRRNTTIHKIFTSLIGISTLNVIFDFIYAYLVINYDMPLDWVDKIYIISLGAVAALICTYLMLMVKENGGKLIIGRVLAGYIPLAVCSLLILILPMQHVHVDGWYMATGTSLYVLYFEISFYILTIIALLVMNRKTLSQKNKVVVIFSSAFMIGAFACQVFNNFTSLTSVGVTLVCICMYMSVENPDMLIIERLTYEKERADSANDSKSAFIANVSHEIRTPINAILGMNEMIIRENTEAVIGQYADDISTAARTLYGIINDVLDMSKMDSGRMDMVPVKYELNQLIYDAISLNQSRIDDKQLDFYVDIDPTIPKGYYGDDVRIKQVLSNLLSNAIKYTHEGFVRLMVNGEYRGDYMDLRFQIKDTGIGIKSEDLEKLFIAFERIEESRNRNIEGTGLGITICSNLLKMMGSRLKVSSVYGEGSIFSFVLTQRIVNPEPIGDFSNFSNKLKSHEGVRFKAPSVKILVVDDNTLNRRVFISLLSNTEMRIDEAESGEACLELTQKDQYDIIFLDHQMPGMDGIETLNYLKNDKDNLNRKTPIVMLTADASSGMQEKYRNAGFDAYLSKPIFLNELEKLIRAYLPSFKIVVEEDKNEEKVVEEANPENWKDRLPSIRGIDWNEAIKHLPTENVLIATLEEFHRSIEPEARILDSCMADLDNPENMEMLRIKAHALKGSAAMIGAEMLSEGAREIEVAAREKDIELLREKYQYMVNYYRTFTERLSMFGNVDNKKKTDIDFPQVIALTEMVALEMEEMNKANAIQCIDEIEAYEYPEEIQENLIRLRTSVEEFDTEQVNELVGSVIGQLRAIR